MSSQFSGLILVNRMMLTDVSGMFHAHLQHQHKFNLLEHQPIIALKLMRLVGTK
jgi:hypothetical protein